MPNESLTLFAAPDRLSCAESSMLPPSFLASSLPPLTVSLAFCVPDFSPSGCTALAALSA